MPSRGSCSIKIKSESTLTPVFGLNAAQLEFNIWSLKKQQIGRNDSVTGDGDLYLVERQLHPALA